MCKCTQKICAEQRVRRVCCRCRKNKARVNVTTASPKMPFFYVADKTSVIESNEIAVKVENEVESVAQFNVVFIAIFLNADNFCAFMIF